MNNSSLKHLVILGSNRSGRFGERVAHSSTLGNWLGGEDMDSAFKSVVDELYCWAASLKVARQTAPYPA